MKGERHKHNTIVTIRFYYVHYTAHTTMDKQHIYALQHADLIKHFQANNQSNVI